MRKRQSNIAALVVDVNADRDIQILPAGVFRARDGRPKGIPGWVCDATIAARLIALANSRQTPFVIDYEHQTMLAEQNGKPAPAAAWFKTLEWREGQGLFATDVEWTDTASAMIKAREYRYLSPVFSYSPATGEVQQILHCALTNVPALDGMEEVVSAASRFIDWPIGQSRIETPDGSGAESLKEIQVNELLKKMLAAIGLPETATETEALSAVTALKAKSDQVGGLETEIAALKSAQPDPAKYVPVTTMTELQSQVAALTTQINGREIDALVGDAMQAGKLLPAQEAWARDLGKKDVAALKGYLDTAQAIVPLKTQTSGKQAGGDQGSLSADEKAVCKAMGLTEEAYLKTKTADAAA